jgi:hypothetical protein
MNVETLGHAGLLIRDDSGKPVLFTDPWITGSCYWRSWWLQHYPGPEQINELKRVAFCFITHEHPDHFHTASIRLLGRGTHYLCPDLPQEHIAGYLAQQGHQVSVVPAFQWKTIHPDVRILSIPMFNDDSVLLVDTPAAVVINMNDAKPRAAQLRHLGRWLDAEMPGKTRVLASSYSPASIVNSFIRDSRRVSLRERADYVHYIGRNCDLLKADFYLPFASQVIFKRSDSAWANDFKVTYADLEAHWSATATKLLPPYTRMNLRDHTYTFVPPEHYRHDDGAAIEKVRAQEALDAAARFDDADLDRLERKLNHGRWLFAMLFPRGIGFALEDGTLHYSPWSGKLTRGSRSGDITMHVPAQAFRDALEYGHFGDLGTTMFTIIKLNGSLHPRRVYLFFMVMSLNDYGHTKTLGNWLKWLKHALTIQRWHIPAAPAQ